ncbi:addiction module protein [Piscirickettsia salmonis]|uniref:Protein adenylyltransferase n=1 Tax=Piscirickettsia salmonis TaxID=1238 RepID=A0A9Q6LRJ8_PISSA|nr:Fic family protein [Piscirickettsia salmonis]ALA25948.1 fic/DOC family protein [Piscirickettsia salmonis]APS43410.1 addiction module protein [Piscirickettsia salmonis]APS46761.1 addiction module protein [Piscirickettsia salmonis]APS50735.1 addiction module protein [Piscirickettsia salmonis]APS53941.1 addiction module protein [Piscirickettsia salmonis]
MKPNLTSLFDLGDIETKSVLKAAAKAHQRLGELKGVVATMPNQYILLGTLPLQEAKDSSEIENVITTNDDLYRSDYATRRFVSNASKEVHSYAQALQEGFNMVEKNGIITNNTIKDIQRILEENDAGFRQQAGTALKNDLTGEIIYTPPQNPQEIISLMGDLEKFINDQEKPDYDPLVKMSIIHHQFESIHPFYDGNGRTGRILNILYLVHQGLLGSPVLYLSRYINQNKGQYYHLLQTVRDQNNWEEWILFMLKGIEQTAQQTTLLVNEIKALMRRYKNSVKNNLPKIYSHDLLNNLFKHPYTKIDFVTQDLQVHRNTAHKYLDQLVELNLISKHKVGNENYYLNDALCGLLANINQMDAANGQ